MKNLPGAAKVVSDSDEAEVNPLSSVVQETLSDAPSAVRVVCPTHPSTFVSGMSSYRIEDMGRAVTARGDEIPLLMSLRGDTRLDLVLGECRFVCWGAEESDLLLHLVDLDGQKMGTFSAFDWSVLEGDDTVVVIISFELLKYLSLAACKLARGHTVVLLRVTRFPVVNVKLETV